MSGKRTICVNQRRCDSNKKRKIFVASLILQYVEGPTRWETVLALVLSCCSDDGQFERQNNLHDFWLIAHLFMESFPWHVPTSEPEPKKTKETGMSAESETLTIVGGTPRERPTQ